MVDKLNKINKATGYKSEKLFWTDVKNKFENAYKQDYQGVNASDMLKFSINSNFKQEYDSWNKIDRQGSFLIGKTSDALKSIGLDDYDIVMDKSKILKIKNDHPEMSDDIIKSIPEILENPTLILNSQSNNVKAEGRKVIFGEILDTKGNPVLVALELNPYENKNNIDKIYKVASAYGKENLNTIQNWINNPKNVLYIDRHKNRTINWLNGLGLQLPVPNNSSSSTNSIPPSGEDVNTTTKYSMQEPKNNTWQTYLDKNYKNTGTGRTVQDVKIAPTAKIELNKVAKNQETLYNNHESESGMNEQIQQSRLLESNNGLSRFSKENINQENRKYTRTEFEDWEKSIKPITESKLSNEQRQIKEDFKRQYNKDIVFFDGKDNKKGYSAGASYTDSKRINIDINQAKEFGTNKIIYHEVMESNILHNLESNRDIIEPALQKIINDPNFEKQKTKFWQGQDGAIPNDYLIAKELLCDRYAEMKTGETWDYDNVLSQETNMTIDFAIENFEKQLKNSSTKLANNIVEKNKTLNPVEISNLNCEDANTTPELKNKTYEKGNKQTSFLSNITTDAKFLNEDLRQVMSKDENIQCLDMI